MTRTDGVYLLNNLYCLIGQMKQSNEMGGEANKDGQKGRKEKDEEKVETEEQSGEIKLPQDEPLGEKEAVMKWLDSTVSPTPGVDEEMEDLVSLLENGTRNEVNKMPPLGLQIPLALLNRF